MSKEADQIWGGENEGDDVWRRKVMARLETAAHSHTDAHTHSHINTHTRQRFHTREAKTARLAFGPRSVRDNFYDL